MPKGLFWILSSGTVICLKSTILHGTGPRIEFRNLAQAQAAAEKVSAQAATAEAQNLGENDRAKQGSEAFYFEGFLKVIFVELNVVKNCARGIPATKACFLPTLFILPRWRWMNLGLMPWKERKRRKGRSGTRFEVC